jgi:hypothetical protein
MLRNAEIKFLQGKRVSEQYSRVLHHRINRKLEKLSDIMPLLIENGYEIPHITECCNNVTENSNITQNENNQKISYF